jgi:hypothetical protein
MPYVTESSEVRIVTMTAGPSAGKQVLQLTHLVKTATGPKQQEPLLMIARDAESLAETLLRAVAALRGDSTYDEAGPKH